MGLTMEEGGGVMGLTDNGRKGGWCDGVDNRRGGVGMGLIMEEGGEGSWRWVLWRVGWLSGGQVMKIIQSITINHNFSEILKIIKYYN